MPQREKWKTRRYWVWRHSLVALPLLVLLLTTIGASAPSELNTGDSDPYTAYKGAVGFLGLLVFALMVAVGALTLNIVRRRRAEEELRSRETQNRLLLEQANAIVWTVDKNLQITYSRGAALAKLGLAQGQIVGRSLSELVQPNRGHDIVHTSVNKALDGQSVVYEDLVAGIKWETRIEPLREADGRISGCVAVSQDITERKRAEMALEESENRLKTLIENSPDAFFTHDLAGHYQQVNETACQWLGFSRDELLRMSVFDIEQNVPQAASTDLWKKIAGGSVLSVEGEYQRKDGSRFPVEIRLSAIRIGGHPLIFGFARDITQRREMELEKEKVRNRLLQAHKMEAIGTLAGGIAHDFNNLMMGIQGRASLMAADLERSHPCFEHIPAIQEYTRSASELTRQLLGIAQGGKYEVKPIDLNEVVLDSATMFGRTKKDVRIHSQLCDPAPVAAVDRGQIEQVLLNLFVNAWQAMPSGGEIFLETDVAHLDEAFCDPHSVPPGAYARVSITDTGIGMDKVTRLRIFDPFFTTKEKGRGTGLGLASAHGIIKNHAGVISVYSEPGRGTTFNIYLPLTDQEAFRQEKVEEPIVGGNETILLVDDENMIIQVNQAMLERLGYKTYVAGSGSQAIEILEKNNSRIDLVILDIIMPGMDGSQTFDHIRRLKPQIPVILSSGYAFNGKAAEIMAKGCNGFIQKPFSLPDLSHKIRQILSRKDDQ